MHIEAGVQVGGAHPVLDQRGHLVLHQRDERRDHDGGAGAQQGRDLIAQRFAAAGGHQHQRVSAARHVLDDGLLGATKALKAKDFLQYLEGCRVAVHRCSPCRVREGELSHETLRDFA